MDRNARPLLAEEVVAEDVEKAAAGVAEEDAGGVKRNRIAVHLQ